MATTHPSFYQLHYVYIATSTTAIDDAQTASDFRCYQALFLSHNSGLKPNKPPHTLAMLIKQLKSLLNNLKYLYECALAGVDCFPIFAAGSLGDFFKSLGATSMF
jgi:hypothetical protein